MDFAWEVDSHRSLMRQYAPNRPTPKGWDTVARTPANLLNRYTVDVLVIEQSEVSNRIRSTEPDWFRWFKHTPSKNLPRVVLELCSPAALVCMPHHGGRDKGLRKRTFNLLPSSSLPEWRETRSFRVRRAPRNSQVAKFYSMHLSPRPHAHHFLWSGSCCALTMFCM
jgi:hypothetical protein